MPFIDEDYEAQAAARRHEMLCEAVVSRTSPLSNKTIREANFRARYNAAVVAVHRGGHRLQGRVGDIELQQGDTLLLQAGPHFVDAQRNNSDFFLVSGVNDSRAVRHDKALLSLGLLGMLILLMTTGKMEIVLAAFLVAGLMIGTRCLGGGCPTERGLAGAHHHWPRLDRNRLQFGAQLLRKGRGGAPWDRGRCCGRT